MNGEAFALLCFASVLSLNRSYFLDRADTEKRIIDVVKNFQKVPADKVTPTAHFINDLGLDSLDQVEVVMAFEQEFLLDIPDNEVCENPYCVVLFSKIFTISVQFCKS